MTAPTLEQYIRQFRLDEIFSRNLIEMMTLKRFNKGNHLCKLGEELNFFYLLVEGKLKIYTLQANGKKILLRFYRPLSIVGDLEFLSNYPPNAFVEALEKTTVIAVPMDSVRTHAADSPVFLRFVILQLSHKLYTHSVVAAMNLVYPLENRVASYLWSLSAIDNDRQLEEIRVNSLEEMANLLCTSYRHLSRVLKKLESKGILERKKGKIKILDFDGLNALSVGLFE